MRPYVPMPQSAVLAKHRHSRAAVCRAAKDPNFPIQFPSMTEKAWTKLVTNVSDDRYRADPDNYLNDHDLGITEEVSEGALLLSCALSCTLRTLFPERTAAMRKVCSDPCFLTI